MTNPWLLIILVLDSLQHFLFSACAGCMGFYAIWIMCWFFGLVGYPLPSRIWPTRQDDHYIYQACYIGALLASSIVHNWLDGLLG